MMSAMRREIRACLAICLAACSTAYSTTPAAATTRSTPSSSRGRVLSWSARSATEPSRTSVSEDFLPREPCSHHWRSVAASKGRLGVLFLPESAGVEDADHPKSFLEIC